MKVVMTAALWLLCGCCFAQVQQRWLGIQGSSTASCYGSSSYYTCWVNLLDNYYDVPGKWDTKVDQVAKPGYSPYEGMVASYVPPAGRPLPDPGYDVTKMLSFTPLAATVIVNYPTNGYDTYTITESMACLRAIRDNYLQAGIRCFITTSQPRTSGNFATSDAKKKLAEIKDSVLMEFGDYAIDFWTPLVNPVDSSILPQYDSGDQTHLNDAGHQVIFNQVIQKSIFVEPLALPQFLFKAKEENDDNVQLTWKNSSDEDVKTFSVQRSDDGSTFATIYTCGAGADSYTYNDKQPTSGNNFYRLKVEFTSGFVDYSPIATIVNRSNAFYLSGVMDANGSVKCKIHSKINQSVVITIYSSNGAVIANEKRNIVEGQSSVMLNNLNVPHGMYYLKCTAVKTGESTTSAFMAQ
jgi:hypothetical protein